MKTVLKSNRTMVAGLAVVAALLFSSCELNDEQAQVAHHMNSSRRSVLGDNATIGTDWNAQLKAQAWAEKLASEGRLYHSNIREGMGNCWSSLGENVGYGPSIEKINDAYMNSPAHRANIVNPNFNAIGVGHAIGEVNGHRTHFTVHVFVQTRPC